MILERVFGYISEDEMGGTCGTYGYRCAYRILTGKPERIGPPVRPRNTLEDNIKMDLKDIYWDGVYCVLMCRGGNTRRAVLNTASNLAFTVKFGDFLTS